MRKGPARYAADSVASTHVSRDDDPDAVGTYSVKHVRFAVSETRKRKASSRETNRQIRKNEVRDMQRAIAAVGRGDDSSDDDSFRGGSGSWSSPVAGGRNLLLLGY